MSVRKPGSGVNGSGVTPMMHSKQPHEVIGVLSAAFNDWRYLGNVDFFRPFALTPEFAANRSEQSLRIIEQALDLIPAGPFMAAKVPRVLKLPPGDTCYAVEAARGRFMVRIVSDGKDQPYRVKLRAPSFSNLSLYEEASKGMILPDAYLRAVADAVHAVGGLFVLDCIASGAIWVDMQACGIDVLVSAPQKGWSSSPCCAMVMLSERARAAIDSTQSTTFAMDLKKWLQIMETYEGGGHAYHTTLPTDALVRLYDTMLETEQYGYERVKQEQMALGRSVEDTEALLRQEGADEATARAMAPHRSFAGDIPSHVLWLDRLDPERVRLTASRVGAEGKVDEKSGGSSVQFQLR